MQGVELGEAGPEIPKAHNELMKREVPRHRLLVFNVKQGRKPLCQFWGVERVFESSPPSSRSSSPLVSTPGLVLSSRRRWRGLCRNDAPTIKQALLGAQLMGPCAYALYAVAAVGSTVLAIKPEYYMPALKRLMPGSM